MNIVYLENWIWWLIVPVSITALVLIYRRADHALGTWFEPSQYRFSFPVIKAWMRGTALVLVALALLGPSESQQERTVIQAGREVLLLLDVSASMHSEDIRPSRLSKAKRELKTLIDDLQGDRLGLIVFADQAFVQCPLTRDTEALELFLELAEPEQFVQSGTNFRQALALALERFTSTDRPGEDRSRAIVLISDGEDFGQTYTSVTNRLKEQNIPVFTVGIGTREGAQVPNYVEGKRQGIKLMEDGSPVISRLLDESLQALAQDFDTRYSVISASYHHLKGLAGQIRLLTATPFESQREKVANNRYQLFLLPAILLLFASMFFMPIEKK